MRDDYEIYLLEFRQGLKEAEKQLKNLACVDLSRFRKLIKIQTLIDFELVDYTDGSGKKNSDLIRLMEG